MSFVCATGNGGGHRVFSETTSLVMTASGPVHMVTGRTYTLRIGAQVLGRVEEDATTGSRRVIWSILSDGKAIGEYDTGRSSYRQQYYHRDHLGSVRVAERYKSGGFAIAQATDYYAFGGVMPSRDVRGSLSAREGYTGHELDRATGLVYAGARYYDPVVARRTARTTTSWAIL